MEMTRIASGSHPGTVAWLTRQPVGRGEHFTVTVAADLPAMDLRAGDAVTVRPQPRWDCDCRYLLDSGEIVRASFTSTAGQRRVVFPSGAVEHMPAAALDARIVGRVVAVRGLVGEVA